MAELERTAGHAHHAVAVPETAPGVGTYVVMGVITFVFTLIEIWVAQNAALAGVQKPILVALLAANFALSALYYQGLQYEDGLSKLSFGVGVVLGLLVAVSLAVLLQLGVIIR